MECFKPRCWIWPIGLLLIVLLFGFLFRIPLLKACATYLDRSEEPVAADRCFILSGNPNDRAAAAIELYQAGLVDQLVCLGSNTHRLMELFDYELTEASLTAQSLRRAGLAESAFEVLPLGSSTLEEAEAVFDYCEKRELKRILVVTNRFHTRRAMRVFKNEFGKTDIEIRFIGVNSSLFDEESWWKSEEGMLALFTEYAKSAYYWLNHY